MFKKLFSKEIKKIKIWASENVGGIFLFNLVLLTLALLQFAGYFNPFLPININFIYFVSLVLSVLLLRAGSKAIFIIGFLLWFFAAFLQAVHVDVWAERTAEYVFQAILIGVLLVFLESLKRLKKYN